MEQHRIECVHCKDPESRKPSALHINVLVSVLESGERLPYCSEQDAGGTLHTAVTVPVSASTTLGFVGEAVTSFLQQHTRSQCVPAGHYGGLVVMPRAIGSALILIVQVPLRSQRAAVVVRAADVQAAPIDVASTAESDAQVTREGVCHLRFERGSVSKVCMGPVCNLAWADHIVHESHIWTSDALFHRFNVTLNGEGLLCSQKQCCRFAESSMC